MFLALHQWILFDTYSTQCISWVRGSVALGTADVNILNWRAGADRGATVKSMPRQTKLRVVSIFSLVVGNTIRVMGNRSRMISSVHKRCHHSDNIFRKSEISFFTLFACIRQTSHILGHVTWRMYALINIILCFKGHGCLLPEPSCSLSFYCFLTMKYIVNDRFWSAPLESIVDATKHTWK